MVMADARCGCFARARRDAGAGWNIAGEAFVSCWASTRSGKRWIVRDTDVPLSPIVMVSYDARVGASRERSSNGCAADRVDRRATTRRATVLGGVHLRI